MEHKIVMVKAPMLKRICAFVIDLFAYICLSFLLSTILISPIVSVFPKVQNDRNEYKDFVLSTGIYQGGSYETIDYIKKDYDLKITEFYKKFDKVENYEKLKGEKYKDYFVYDEITGTYSDALEEKKMVKVYNAILENDCMAILNKNQEFLDISFRVTTYEMADVFASLILGGLIYYIVIPLCLKNGQTLGKKLLQLYVVSLTGDYRIRPMKLITRNLFLLVGEILLCVITFGLVPFISLIVAAVNKKGQSLHDFIVQSTVVDTAAITGKAKESQEILLTSYASEEQMIFDGEVSSNENVNEEVENDG